MHYSKVCNYENNMTVWEMPIL